MNFGDLIARRKDFVGGLLILLIGLLTTNASRHYDIGSLRRMGPGYFPLLLGVILTLTGALIMLTARTDAHARAPAAQWRGWLAICAGILAFLAFGERFGLLPATFATVFISALGDRQNSARTALILAVLMSIVCAIVFWWLLQVQMPLFRWGQE